MFVLTHPTCPDAASHINSDDDTKLFRGLNGSDAAWKSVMYCSRKSWSSNGHAGLSGGHTILHYIYIYTNPVCFLPWKSPTLKLVFLAIQKGMSCLRSPQNRRPGLLGSKQSKSDRNRLIHSAHRTSRTSRESRWACSATAPLEVRARSLSLSLSLWAGPSARRRGQQPPTNVRFGK